MDYVLRYSIHSWEKNCRILDFTLTRSAVFLSEQIDEFFLEICSSTLDFLTAITTILRRRHDYFIEAWV